MDLGYIIIILQVLSIFMTASVGLWIYESVEKYLNEFKKDKMKIQGVIEEWINNQNENL